MLRQSNSIMNSYLMYSTFSVALLMCSYWIFQSNDKFYNAVHRDLSWDMLFMFVQMLFIAIGLTYYMERRKERSIKK